jgi:hypothetical protein
MLAILLSDMPQYVLHLCIISRPICKNNKSWNIPLDPERLLLLNISYNIYEKRFNGISVSNVFKEGQAAGCARGSLVHNEPMTLISYEPNLTHILSYIWQNIF